MMKIKSQYCCQGCGYVSTKWLGRCPGCGSWNSFAEETSGSGIVEADQGTLSSVREEFKSFRDIKPGDNWVLLEGNEPEGSQQSADRLGTSIGELDRVLGGGLLPDSFVLLGGDPGIGKSTLLLQMAKGLLQAQSGVRILYVSGEESVEQIRSRAKRLGVSGGQSVFLAAETQLEKAFATIKELKPHVVIMDSLQTFSSAHLESAPGSVSQVREVAARLMTLAKTAGIAVCLVGHVTKDGSIAGPKVVEHMVDTVLYFEGDEGHSYRLLRTVKNRFGSTKELGVFEMSGDGLQEVSNPSSLFLSDRQKPLPGVAVTASLEGSRPLLVELQALVAPSPLSVPRRTAVGMDSNRIALLAAILDRHMDLSLAETDLFFNVAGGLRISEPACDLAAAAAIWSSASKRAFPSDWVFLGEVGLTGEVRRISQGESRIQEARKLGFKTVVVPPGVKISESAGSGLSVLTLARICDLPTLI